MAFDQGFAERIRDLPIKMPHISERRTLGGIVDALVRVGPANYAAALKRAHPMKGYVYVDPAGVARNFLA